VSDSAKVDCMKYNARESTGHMTVHAYWISVDMTRVPRQLALLVDRFSNAQTVS